LYMASSLTLIRTYAAEFSDHPAQVLAAANQRLIKDTHSGLFVTLFYGILDPASGQMTYCNAGHNPPLLFNPARKQFSRSLTKTGIPLGVMENTAWEEINITLEPGDLLTLFTDGVTEAQNSQGEFYGEERLKQCLHSIQASHSPQQFYAQTILNELFEDISNFLGSSPRSDDLTLLVLTRNLD